MLYIPRYHQTQTLETGSFLKQSESEEVLFVASNPEAADRMRKALQKNHLNFDVITISQFRNNEFGFFIEEEVSIKRKSELLLIFGTIWKKFFNDYEYEYFQRAFNLLTDLRSFGLYEELYTSVLGEYDAVLQKSILVFSNLLKSMEIYDEHAAYNELASKIREVSFEDYYEKKRHLVFYGFQHFSTIQIDFLKSLSIRDDVYVCLPELVFQKRKKHDWISWLLESNVETPLLDKELKEKKVFYKEFAPFTLNKTLNSSKWYNSDFIIASPRTSFEDINELPLFELNFKVSIDIFLDVTNRIEKKLEKYFQSDNSRNISEIISFLNDEKNKMLAKEDFRSYKVLIELESLFNNWIELSEDNREINQRDLRIIFEASRLNLPRNSYFPISKEQGNRVYNLKNYIHSPKQAVICATSKQAQLRPKLNLYPEKVEEYLLSIGPLKSPDIDYYFIRHDIEEIMHQENSVLLLEKGMRQQSEDWDNVLEGWELEGINKEKIVDNKGFKFRIMKDKKDLLENISASKLQTYLDCPQKYYFNYLEKISPEIEYKSKLMPNHLGELEHKAVEVFFQEFPQKRSIEEISLHLLTAFLKKNQIVISQNDFEKYFIELKNYSGNAVRFLQELKKVEGAIFEFEKKIQKQKGSVARRGSIDFWGQSKTTGYLIDFKRSKTSIPSKSQILSLEKIQLWFYLNSVKQNLETNSSYFVGYLNLSDIADSLFFSNNPVLVDFLSCYDDLGLKSYEFENLKEQIQEYDNYETSLIETIKKDECFHSIPSSPQNCLYCEVKMICPRSHGETAQ